SPSRRWSWPTAWPAATCWRSPEPDRARHSRSRSRSWSASVRRSPRRAQWCSFPRASSRCRWPKSSPTSLGSRGSAWPPRTGVAGLARAYTRDPKGHEVEAPRETVDEAEHRFVSVTQDGKVKALVDLLQRESGSALVFVRTKRGADRLVHKLQTHGVEAAAMHG